MNKILKDILVKIEDAGFEAYIVGGYVRDYLLGINSFDIDICTNAKIKDLENIFKGKTLTNNYGGFNIQVDNYNIDITTYRKELKYEKRKPVEIIYIDSLEEDIKRRDFTINAICMDKGGKIIDLLNGVNDLNNKIIKTIGNPTQKLQEDPLRILRAIRFATILDFKIDNELLKTIKDNYHLVSSLSSFRIKEELNKILLHKNYLKGLELLKILGILELLNISYPKDMVYIDNIYGMWAQLEVKEYFGFTKKEIRNIINIGSIIKDGNINKRTIYNYGLESSLVAGKILNISSEDINGMYKSLPIKCEQDLDITSKEIVSILNIEPSDLNKIKSELIDLILDGKLKNKNLEIKNFLEKK